MMEAIGRPNAEPRRSSAFVAGSAALHLFVIGLLIYKGAAWAPPLQHPGNNKDGPHLLLTYSHGQAPLRTSVPDLQVEPKQTPSKVSLALPRTHKTSAATVSPTKTSPAPAQSDSAVGADALGSDNITLPVLSVFPTPKPDLSVLPRGTKGNVILEIVIDNAGKVVDIQVASGLGHGVDETVIATVQQWTFQPATKDGRPVASELELHFHYEA